VAGAIQNREDAFREIEKIARYFEAHEPQSLVLFALRKAVAWGKMPLPELLAEFVPEDGARSRFSWLGIKAPENKSE